MNLFAVKALEDRAKYIVDVYHYGVNCNACKYEYLKYAQLDFINQCFDVCETVTPTSVIDTAIVTNCTPVIPVEIETPSCTPSITVEEL